MWHKGLAAGKEPRTVVAGTFHFGTTGILIANMSFWGLVIPVWAATMRFEVHSAGNRGLRLENTHEPPIPPCPAAAVVRAFCRWKCFSYNLLHRCERF